MCVYLQGLGAHKSPLKSFKFKINFSLILSQTVIKRAIISMITIVYGLKSFKN